MAWFPYGDLPDIVSELRDIVPQKSSWVSARQSWRMVGCDLHQGPLRFGLPPRCCGSAAEGRWSIKMVDDPNYGTDVVAADIHDVGMLGHNPNGSKPSTTVGQRVVGTRPAVRGMHLGMSAYARASTKGCATSNGKVSESAGFRGSIGNLHMKGMASTTVFTHFLLGVHLLDSDAGGEGSAPKTQR